MISRSNYEIVFIDYFDGKLDKVQEQELFEFLSLNQDLKEEFNLFSAIRTEPDLTIRFGEKDKLKKEVITNYNYKTWLVAYLENDLSTDQKKEVDYFLSKNSGLKPEFEILKLTRLVPDSRIIFDKKNTLKRGAKVIAFTPAVKRTLSIAAAIIFLALTYFIIQQFNAPKSMVADHKENKINNSNENKISNEQKSADPENKTENLKKSIPKSLDAKESNSIADNSSRRLNSGGKLNKKELPNGIMRDTLSPIQLKPTQEIALNKSEEKIIPKRGPLENEITSKNSTPLNVPANKLSEIFNNEDLKELGLAANNSENEKSGSKSLKDLAADELKKISKSTEISFDKQKDPLGNSVTYAFEVGKSFSISHTVVQ